MNLDAWSEYELLVACSVGEVIFNLKGGTTVIRITDSILVKIVMPDDREYMNQKAAYRELQGTKLKVPKPLRHFVRGLRSYLFMEYIKGGTLEQRFVRDSHSKTSLLPRVRSALESL
jgi:serine/threonine protein kinase